MRWFSQPVPFIETDPILRQHYSFEPWVQRTEILQRTIPSTGKNANAPSRNNGNADKIAKRRQQTVEIQVTAFVPAIYKTS